MRNKTVFICLLLLVGASLFAQANVTGWDKASWGMSKARVEGLYKKEGVHPDGDKLIIESKIINSKPFRVVFSFDNNKLNDIFLVQNPADFDDYAKVSKLLIQKYGKSTHNDAQSTMWTFPKTIVEIKYQTIGILRLLVINYKEKVDSGF